MSYAQGIGTLAAGVALGVLATSTYFRLWNGRTSINHGTLLRFSPELSTQTVRRLDPNFAVCYDRRTRVPLWTIEYLTRETIKPGNNVDRGKSIFREDDYIHPYFRSTNQDYSRKLKQIMNSNFLILLNIFKVLVLIVVTLFQVLIIDILKEA